jgi:glucose-6-phosphate dehydrogenase assembly protein OpcA
VDDVWRERDTTPGAVEAALRSMFVQRHKEARAYVPARVMNLVVIVDAEFRGEIENRLQRVGRFHPSRLVVCAVEDGRRKLDAWASIGTEDAPKSGEITVGREKIELLLGDRHLAKLDAIVDPLVVSDLATMVWAPHGHDDAVDVLRRLAQVVLLDSLEAPDMHSALDRAESLSDDLYVVDLAWLRSTPWRRRPELREISGITVRHREDSLAAAVLFCGWLGSRLGWQPGSLSQHGNRWSGGAHTRRQDVKIRLEPHEQEAPGLAGVTVDIASGQTMALDRAPGGLKASRRERDGSEREWMVMGASRGEGGILGEGVRQALLRDPTYRPALAAAQGMVR